MEENFNAFTKELNKQLIAHKKIIAALSLIAIIFLVATSQGWFASIVNVVNPGVEGAKSNCYGVYITSSTYGNQKGLNTVHFRGDNEIPIASAGESSYVFHFGSYPSQGEVWKWGPGSGPSSMTVQHFVNSYYPTKSTVKENQIATEVETNIELQNLTQYGTALPLQGTNSPTQGVYIEYWHLNQTTNPDGSITNTVTEQDILLVPGNFHLTVWIPPSKDHSAEASGWEEGTWSNLELWYTIYWYDWLNSLGAVIQNQNTAPPIVPANVSRQGLFSLRGGVPISAWIQGYSVPMQTSTGTIYDVLQAQAASGKTTKTYAGSQLPSDVYANLVSITENGLTPSLVGRPIDLYTQPSDQFKYVDLTTSDVTAAGINAAPDAQTMLPQEYFKIGVLGLGTIPHVSGGILGTGVGATYTVYYPAVNYLIRLIMGVYGQHTYVWTTQTAQQLGYSGWQNRTVAVTVTPGVVWPSFSWTQLFSPLNLEFLAVLIIAAIVIVTIFNPGIWSQILGSRGSRSTGARKSRKSK